MTANTEAYLDFLARVPRSYLNCRTMQHRWGDDAEFTLVDSGRETGRRARGGEQVFAERVVVCDRCGMERSTAYRVTSTRGHVALVPIAVTYSPPPGYSLHGVGPVGRDLLLGLVYEQDLGRPGGRGRRRR
jgi:hypothetical protein